MTGIDCHPIPLATSVQVAGNVAGPSTMQPKVAGNTAGTMTTVHAPKVASKWSLLTDATDLPSREKDAPTTIEQKRKICREVKGMGEYYDTPCSICQKAGKQCEIKEVRGLCFVCAKRKEKCEYAGPKGGHRSTKPAKCRVPTGTKRTIKSKKYITDEDVDTDASDVPLARIPVKLAPAPASKPKVKKYVEVTDEEMDGSSDLRLALAPLTFTPAQRQCTYFIYV
jgi:hypothetical protein